LFDGIDCLHDEEARTDHRQPLFDSSTVVSLLQHLMNQRNRIGTLPNR